MARLSDRKRALELRLQGRSYSKIKAELKVSKSTLSLWLRGYPLSEERIRELRDWNEVRIERCRETKRKKKERRLEETRKRMKKEIFPLTIRDIFLAGLFLYWGEGAKTRVSDLCISNTDPGVIQFFILWTTTCLKLPREKIRIHLHLYSDMSIGNETGYWSSVLKVPKEQFRKPYIKESLSTRINHCSFKHGTCNASISNARLTEEIICSLDIVKEYLNKN